MEIKDVWLMDNRKHELGVELRVDFTNDWHVGVTICKPYGLRETIDAFNLAVSEMVQRLQIINARCTCFETYQRHNPPTSNGNCPACGEPREPVK